MVFKIRESILVVEQLTGRKTLYLFLLLFFCFQFSVTNAQKDSSRVLQTDTRAIIPRYPSRATLEEISNDRDYQYKEESAPPENPFARWFFEIWKKFQSLFSGKSYEHFWQYAMMAATLFFALFLLYKAGILNYVFPAKEKKYVQDYVVGQENIHDMNLDRALDSALASGDFRLAIRLQYLTTLKMLSEKELINWQPNRTNQSYVQELQKRSFHTDFARITRYFEFAWYGDFKIEKTEYEEMKAFSGSFNDQLNQRSYV
jgi:hypothetical protein